MPSISNIFIDIFACVYLLCQIAGSDGIEAGSWTRQISNQLKSFKDAKTVESDGKQVH